MARFDFRVDRRFLPLLVANGLRPGRDGVEVDGGRFRASFGFVKVSTDLANVSDAHVTTGYKWWRAIGTRLSFADDGLTLGTNTEAGLCVHFVQPVPSRLRRRGHSAVTVTVADPDGLRAALGVSS